MLRTSLIWKLVLAFLVVAITAAALVAIFIRETSVDRLTRLIVDQQGAALQTALTEYYASRGSWGNVANDWTQIRYQAYGVTPVPPPPDAALVPQITPPQDAAASLPAGAPTPQAGAAPVENIYQEHPPRPPDFGHERRRIFGLADSSGVVLIPVGNDYPAGSTAPDTLTSRGIPVEVNGARVGTILTVQMLPLLNPEEDLFIRRTNQALMLAGLGAMLVALVIGLVLARTLIRPLHALTDAAQKIAAGQLEQKVEIKSKDEIGRLAAAFNQMSQEVSRVNQQRRQMTADIAHDLRTPLTVIAGYVESMQDGVLQPTPQRLALIYAEIESLQNLVGDLRMLSQADAGELPLHPQPIAPQDILERVAALFQHHAGQCGIDLQVKVEDGLPDIIVDEDRMAQVFNNLVGNALRYTPEGGRILLSTRRQEDTVVLEVADTGSGIDPAELPFIFERFHRADKSRQGEDGETGLGLAIVKALVEAQGGKVHAESTPGAGTIISITFPAPA